MDIAALCIGCIPVYLVVIGIVLRLFKEPPATPRCSTRELEPEWYHDNDIPPVYPHDHLLM